MGSNVWCLLASFESVTYADNFIRPSSSLNQEFHFPAKCSAENIKSKIFLSNGRNGERRKKILALMPMRNRRQFCLELCFSIKCSKCKYLLATIPSLLATQLFAACVTRGTTSKICLMYSNLLQCIHLICLYLTFAAAHMASACVPAWLVFTFPYVNGSKLITGA